MLRLGNNRPASGFIGVGDGIRDNLVRPFPLVEVLAASVVTDFPRAYSLVLEELDPWKDF